ICKLDTLSGSHVRYLYFSANYDERLVQNNSIKTLLRQVIRANGGSRMFKKLGDYRRLKIIAVLGILVILASAVTVAVPVYAKSDHSVKSEHSAQSRASIFGKSASFTITGTGTAHDIADQTKTANVDLQLTATAEKVTFGVAKLSVSGGT